MYLLNKSYCNNVDSDIIVYVSRDLSCKVLNVNVDFSEYFILEIEGCSAYNKTTIGVI